MRDLKDDAKNALFARRVKSVLQTNPKKENPRTKVYEVDKSRVTMMFEGKLL